MDTSTAQTGITIWNALLVASIPGIITAIVGYFLSSKVASKKISLQVKKELDKEMKLLDEKIRKAREEKIWNLKFDLYVEIQSIYAESANILIKDDKEEFRLYRERLSLLLHKCNALFEDLEIARNLLKLQASLGGPGNKAPEKFDAVNFSSVIDDCLTRTKIELKIK